ncbi:MAG: M14 family metallopeptidase [Planctomycetota bacterium]
MLRACVQGVLLLVCCGGGVATCADEFPYRGDESYRGELTAPGPFLGWSLGDRFTPHRDVLRYCRYLADNSPRATLVEYGRSPEGRELFYLLVSTPESLQRVDEIRAAQMKLADPRRIDDADKWQQELAQLPAVLWLSYNVHGNEPSPTETALRALYQLTDDQGPTTQKILDGALIIIDPLLNPDGRERYLQWFHSVAAPGGNPDPAAREHREPAPGGRSNHYYFDLNRDWAWQSQPETQQRLVHYLKWQPLIHGDFHEMGPESSYFFFPAEPPINANLPDHTTRWGKTFGRANAAAFDRFGWRYYTAESFDLFYPGYGDTWPSFHGAIGMTYEQGGGPRGGIRYQRRNGSMLTLRERLYHHFVTTFATLECAVDQRAELQQSFHEFRKGPELEEHEVVEYVIPAAGGHGRARQLVELLLKQGIEVNRTTTEAVAESLRTHPGDEKEAVKLDAGTFIVAVEQPAGRLAAALLEPEAEVMENKFYDVSAWSLPFAMGVPVYSSQQRIAVERQPILEVDAPQGRVVGKARYAYLLPWGGMAAVRALLELQRAGVRVSLIPQEIETAAVVGRDGTTPGRQFPAGTLLIPVGAGSDHVHEVVQRVAVTCGVEIFATDSGWTDKGVDFGSDQIIDLKAARVAVASGEGVYGSSFGAIWSLFERELQLPFTAFNAKDLGRLDLRRYDVLILPDGRYRGVLDKRTVAVLRSWVRAGGVLVALGGPSFQFAAEGIDLVAASSKPRKEDSGKSALKEKPRRKIADQRERNRERQVPGSIFQVDLDAEHPLSFGLGTDVFVFMESTRSFAVSGDSGDVGAFTQDPAISGYISEANIDKVRRRVYLREERSGSGTVVLFAGDPNFRLFWRGTTPLFLNAVLLRAAY